MMVKGNNFFIKHTRIYGTDRVITIILNKMKYEQYCTLFRLYPALKMMGGRRILKKISGSKVA